MERFIQAVLTKSIELPTEPTTTIGRFEPILVDLNTMVAFWHGKHFDIKEDEFIESS